MVSSPSHLYIWTWHLISLGQPAKETLLINIFPLYCPGMKSSEVHQINLSRLGVLWLAYFTWKSPTTKIFVANYLIIPKSVYEISFDIIRYPLWCDKYQQPKFLSSQTMPQPCHTFEWTEKLSTKRPIFYIGKSSELWNGSTGPSWRTDKRKCRSSMVSFFANHGSKARSQWRTIYLESIQT